MLRYAAILILAISMAGASPEVQSLMITGPEPTELVQGGTCRISWAGEGIDTVRVEARGERTPMGRTSRGSFDIIIAEQAPAQEGAVTWQVPWIDAIRLTISVTGLDPQGQAVGQDERVYEFRPAVLARRKADGIYLDLHQRVNQRLYVEKGGHLVRAFLSSSSENYHWVPRTRHPSAAHDHAGIFRVIGKTRMHISRLFNAKMPWSLNYVAGHFIHGTIAEYYPLLGQPASHGCNRMTDEDAHELYLMTPVGTRVEVIGPAG